MLMMCPKCGRNLEGKIVRCPDCGVELDVQYSPVMMTGGRTKSSFTPTNFIMKTVPAGRSGIAQGVESLDVSHGGFVPFNRFLNCSAGRGGVSREKQGAAR